MTMTSKTDIPALLFLLIVTPGFGSELSAIVGTMGSKHECEQYPSKIHWISDKTSALVIGKSEDSIKVCRLKFGLASTTDGARIRLSFDSMYNHACGVYLQINESTDKDFSDTNKEMFMSGCNTKDPGPLFAQPKNFILISLVKDNEGLVAYNFRLNISMAGHLPSRGPELHVVIIVGFVLITLVVISAILLFKYVTRLSYNWPELQMEEAGAIYVYSSQDPLQIPNLTHSRPAGNLQPVKSQAGGSQVHSDGQFDRFYPQDSSQNDQNDLINRKLIVKNLDKRTKSTEPRNSQELQNLNVLGHSKPPASFQPANMDLETMTTPCLANDLGDNVSLGGFDVPPSYEEALGMPLATDIDTDTDNFVEGRLEFNLLNEDVDDSEESLQHRSAAIGVNNEVRDSGAFT